MSEERLFRTEGIVIKRADMGEADRLLVLYTPQRGRLRAAAKGARKLTSRLGGHLELFSQVKVMIAHGRNLDYVTQVESINPFMALREDLDTLSRACYLSELVDQFGEENCPSDALYSLLLDALTALPACSRPDLLLRHFELHLLGLSGYRPELGQCAVCRCDIEAVSNSFSVMAGGVVCPTCAAAQITRRELSVNLLKSLRYLQTSDLDSALRLRPPSQLAWEMEALLAETLRYTLERELKSTEFIHILRRNLQTRPE